MPQEIELKYQVTDLWAQGMAQRVWLASPRFGMGPSRQTLCLDIYWDTGDFALLRAGFGLRTRHEEGNWLVGLKSTGSGDGTALSNRLELEAVIPEDLRADLLTALYHGGGLAVDRLLDPLRQADLPVPPAAAVGNGDEDAPPLRPQVAVDQIRVKRPLRLTAQADGATFAEVSLDQTCIHAPAQMGDLLDGIPAQPLSQFWTLEVELTDPAQAPALDELAGLLAADPHVSPTAANKALAGLRVMARQWPGSPPAPSPGVVGAMGMGDAGRQVWRQLLLELLFHESGVAQHQGVAAVHDMRVTLRRMRAADRIFGVYFDDQSVASFRQMMRKTAKRLGTVRDLDVSLLALEEAIALGHVAEDEGIAALRQMWLEAREEAHRRVREWFASPYYVDFLSELMTFCQSREAPLPLDLERIQPSQVSHVMPVQIWSGYSQMRAYAPLIGPDAPLANLHALRIQGKRFRYSLEFVSHLLTQPEGEGLLLFMKGFQDCLGRINDAGVTQESLAHLQEEGRGSPNLARYNEWQESIIREERERFDCMWAELVSVDFRQRLGTALAAL